MDRIYRVADGRRIEGVARPVFIHNFSYHLTSLQIYADGAIHCWEWVDLDGLRDKLDSGWVVTEVPEGAEVGVFQLGRWKDWPLVALATDVGEPPTGGWFQDDKVVTESTRDAALRYFAERERVRAESENKRPADDPERVAGSLHVGGRVFPRGFPENAGIVALQDEYPSPIEVGGVVYPTVTHACWALSTADEGVRERIRAAEKPYAARELAAESARVANWPEARTAVMAGLLRAKFTQHPELAEILLGTGDAPISYTGTDSDHWADRGGRGRNWSGRLLELVRSELQARAAGIEIP